MHLTHLRKVGGSVMLAVPPALLDSLNLRPGAQVGMVIESGRLVVALQKRPRYTLNDLLTQWKARAAGPRTREERPWPGSKPAGHELL